MQPYAISINSLSRDFGPVHAVEHLTLQIPHGIVFGFLGPNGAGKTTTIRLLLGLLVPTGGSASVLGFDVTRNADEIRARTGALLEHHGLYERLSAEDNLDFYGRIYHIPAVQRRARIKELLEHMDLWERRKDLVGTWSRGMKQKLAVARTLIANPPLIFLDEPTAGLDPEASAGLRDDLINLAAREGVTIFLNTHNLAEAEKLCQHVGVIRGGRLLAINTVDELRQSISKPVVTVTGSGFSEEVLSELRRNSEINSACIENHTLSIEFTHPVEIAPIVNFLVSQGVRVEEIQKARASLEDVFITLMQEERRDNYDR